MGKVTATQLVNLLTNEQFDPTQISRTYELLGSELGFESVVTQVTIIPMVAGQADYILPDTAVSLLSLYVNDNELTSATPQMLNTSVGPGWREWEGEPRTYVREDNSSRFFTLFPIPRRDSRAFTLVEGSPLGINFPDDAISVIHTADRSIADLSFPDWLDEFLAFSIVGRIADRDSSARHPQLGAICRSVANGLHSVLVQR